MKNANASIQPAEKNKQPAELISSNTQKDNMRQMRANELLPSNKRLAGTQLREIKKARKKKTFSWNKAARIKSAPDLGLTSEQVAARISEGFVNVTQTKTKKTYLGIIFSNICTFFNILAFLVAGALIFVGAGNNLFFLLIVLSNILIGIIQEFRAKRTMDKLSLITVPTASVIRDGKKIEIPINQLVIDDIVFFKLGTQISADCIVIDGHADVNESLLTGEQNAIKKKPGDMLLGGSFISGGSCIARVERVADACYSNNLAQKAKKFTRSKSELLSSLKFIIRILSILVIVLGALMWFTNLDILSNTQGSSDETRAIAVTRTAGAIIGMIPAGMYLLTSMALVVGFIKLYKKRTLVQDLYSIEMLSRVNMLCLDKTGTLTDGTMSVNKVVKLTNITDSEFKNIMGSVLSALDNNNQTSQALTSYFGRGGSLKATRTIPFSSERKLSAVSFSNAGTYLIGAPEYVSNSITQAALNLIKEFSREGQRVLLLAHSKSGISSGAVPTNAKPVALIIIQDHIREDAYDTISWFTQNEVKVRIISGDNPITVSEVSRRCGVPNAQSYISLAGLNDRQVVEAANKYTVFGRVSPEQKAVLIRAFKAQGHKVAMTGDGVNDILALKESDCSIAMASGSEATRNVSHLVLQDSNFSGLPSVVAEGRRVINNISKSSSLFLMKTGFIIMLAIFALSTQIVFPFAPNQLMLLEIFAIGIPSFFLALQPNHAPVKGSFLAGIIAKAAPPALIFMISFIACWLFDTFAGSGANYETMASYAIAFSGLIMLFAISRPIDWFRGTLFGAMLAGCIITILIVPIEFFGYVELPQESLLFTIIVVQLGFLYIALKKPNLNQHDAKPPEAKPQVILQIEPAKVKAPEIAQEKEPEENNCTNPEVSKAKTVKKKTTARTTTKKQP